MRLRVTVAVIVGLLAAWSVVLAEVTNADVPMETAAGEVPVASSSEVNPTQELTTGGVDVASGEAHPAEAAHDEHSDSGIDVKTTPELMQVRTEPPSDPAVAPVESTTRPDGVVTDGATGAVAAPDGTAPKMEETPSAVAANPAEEGASVHSEAAAASPASEAPPSGEKNVTAAVTQDVAPLSPAQIAVVRPAIRPKGWMQNLAIYAVDGLFLFLGFAPLLSIFAGQSRIGHGAFLLSHLLLGSLGLVSIVARVIDVDSCFSHGRGAIMIFLFGLQLFVVADELIKGSRMAILWGVRGLVGAVTISLACMELTGAAHDGVSWAVFLGVVAILVFSAEDVSEFMSVALSCVIWMYWSYAISLGLYFTFESVLDLLVDIIKLEGTGVVVCLGLVGLDYLSVKRSVHFFAAAPLGLIAMRTVGVCFKVTCLYDSAMSVVLSQAALGAFGMAAYLFMSLLELSFYKKRGVPAVTSSFLNVPVVSVTA